jgi:hypothetical protein
MIIIINSCNEALDKSNEPTLKSLLYKVNVKVSNDIAINPIICTYNTERWQEKQHNTSANGDEEERITHTGHWWESQKERDH